MRPCAAALLLVLGLGPAVSRAQPAHVTAADKATYLIKKYDAGGTLLGGGTAFTALIGDDDLKRCQLPPGSRPRRVLFTAYHVVRGAARVVVIPIREPRKPETPVEISWAIDPQRDLALLVPPIAGDDGLSFAGQEAVKGEVVGLTGNPDGLIAQYDEGVVSAQETFSSNYPQFFGGEQRQKFRIVLTSAAARGGSSGGPVFRRADARILGVAINLAGKTAFRTAAAAASEFLCPLLAAARQHPLGSALGAAAESAADRAYYSSPKNYLVSDEVRLEELPIYVTNAGRGVSGAEVSATVLGPQDEVLYRLSAATVSDNRGQVLLAIPKDSLAEKIKIAAHAAGYSDQGGVTIEPGAALAVVPLRLLGVSMAPRWIFSVQPSILELERALRPIYVSSLLRTPGVPVTNQRARWNAQPASVSWARLWKSEGEIESPEEIWIECLSPESCRRQLSSVSVEITFSAEAGDQRVTKKVELTRGLRPSIVLEGFVLAKDSWVPPDDALLIKALKNGAVVGSAEMEGTNGYFRLYLSEELEDEALELHAEGADYTLRNPVRVRLQRSMIIDPLQVEPRP